MKQNENTLISICSSFIFFALFALYTAIIVKVFAGAMQSVHENMQNLFSGINHFTQSLIQIH